MYKESTENTEIIFPENSLFDSYFIYGLDDSKTLKKVEDSGVTDLSLDTSSFEDTPV